MSLMEPVRPSLTLLKDTFLASSQYPTHVSESYYPSTGPARAKDTFQNYNDYIVSSELDGVQMDSASTGTVSDNGLCLLAHGSTLNNQRPVSAAVNMLVEKAHLQHGMRGLKHPITYNYSMFKWRVQEAADSSKSAASAAASTISSLTRGKSAPPRASPIFQPYPLSDSISYSNVPSVISGPLEVASASVGNESTDTGALAPYHTSGVSSGVSVLSGQIRGSGTTMLAAPVSPRASHRQSFASSTTSLDAGVRGPPAGSLEITCEYDAHFQAADITGHHGVPVRPQPLSQIGPVAWLFRWYAKRNTQFAEGGPRPEDLVDAPPLPPPDPVGPVGPQGGALRPESAHSAPPATVGRRLNRGPDPVMNCDEVVDMLEDFDVVPKLVSRGDVAQLFTAAISVRSDPPNKLLKGGVQPNELRYPQFCDLLIRIAIAVSYTQPVQPTRRRSASGPLVASRPGSADRDGIPTPRRGSYNSMLSILASRRQDAAVNSPAGLFRKSQTGPLQPTLGSRSRRSSQDEVTAASASETQTLPLPPGRQAEILAASEAAQASGPLVALKALMDTMELTHPTLMPLKHKLDHLARIAKEKGVVKMTNKWMYVASSHQSTVAAAIKGQAMPGLGGWGVLSPVRAPAFLVQALLAHDVQTETVYKPCWRAFKEPALNLGPVQPGELRCCRVVLRNRGRSRMLVRVDTSDLPWLAATFNESSLAPGVPRVVDVAVRFPAPGEYSGELRIHTLVTREGVGQRCNTIPIYAACMGGLADTDRKAPTTRSERLTQAPKAAAAGMLLPPRAPPSIARTVAGSELGAMSSFATPSQSYVGRPWSVRSGTSVAAGSAPTFPTGLSSVLGNM